MRTPVSRRLSSGASGTGFEGRETTVDAGSVDTGTGLDTD
jgi:hypothetical protein